MADARRDLNDIGAECVECWNLRDFQISDELDSTDKWEEVLILLLTPRASLPYWWSTTTC